MAMENVFAVVRWLNDNNRLSVHNSKYFHGSKKKETYIPGDEGIACYPGFPGKWNFRVLAVGEKKVMNAWLNSHFNSLMADINDKDIVAATQLKVTSGSDNTNRQAEKVNEEADKTEKDGDTKNDNGPTKAQNGSLIKTTDKQKEKDDAVLKRNVQKDIAEAMLTKRETTKDTHKE